MHHWVLRSCFLGLAFWLAFVAWAQDELGVSPSGKGAGRPLSLLVVYEDDGTGAGDIDAAFTANLAGRFGRSAVRSFEDYRPGEIGGHDAVFVLPRAEGGRPPEALLGDVRAARQPVIWLHHKIASLFEDRAFASAQGWVPAPSLPADYVTVRYKGREFPRDVRAAANVSEPRIGSPDRVLVYASALRRDGSEAPWALRSGNLFYIVEQPYSYMHEDDRYLVFADLLYEMLAPAVRERHRAMVRIEDVGPEADPRRIRALADLLAAEGVPFAMTVYDTYRDPGGRYSRGRPLRISLRQRPQLVRALDYAVSRGATLVAHGHTHQSDERPNPYARVSGGDYEFFAADLRDGAFVLRGPLRDNAIESWRARFAASRLAWRRAGLAHPAIFTTPHYAASPEAYAAARELYSARFERSLYFGGEARAGQSLRSDVWGAQFFPFEVVDVRGDLILPENLGYSATSRGVGENSRRPERLIASAARNLAVRDGFASFFHHWYESPADLRTIVRGIKQLGYRFVGPNEVIRDAPAHARRASASVSPLAASAESWLRALPRVDVPLLAALLALVAAMWIVSESLLRRLGGRGVAAAFPRRRLAEA